MPHLEIISCADIRKIYINTYASYEFNGINNVTRSTGIQTYQIIVICPGTNMPATHTYMFHCTPTLLFIQTPHLHTYNSKTEDSATFI